MGMSIDDAIKKYKNQAEWEHSHNNTDYYEEYEQIAEWLEQLQKIKEIVAHYRENVRDKVTNENMEKILEVVEDGKIEDKDIDLHIDRETLLQEYIPRAEFEQRLKADMVAMLEDLKQDFIAEAYGIEMDCTDYVVNVADIDKIIQQKIKALTEGSRGAERFSGSDHYRQLCINGAIPIL